MKKTFFESGKNWAMVMKRHSQSLRYWIRICAHECAHILEGKECISDHGPWFHDHCAQFGGRFLGNTIFHILEAIFEKK